MLVLSLATLPGGVAQILFRLDPIQALVIDLFDWIVISIFAVEYAVGLNATPSKARFVLASSSVLTLGIIALALLGAVFSFPLLYSLPLLRLLRALKVFDEAGRSSAELNESRL
jgi:hypothetical protein